VSCWDNVFENNLDSRQKWGLPTLFSSWWSPQPPAYRKELSRWDICCTAWWMWTCHNLRDRTRGLSSVYVCIHWFRDSKGVSYIPCNAPLSRKLFRLKSVFLEARYWMKRCRYREEMTQKCKVTHARLDVILQLLICHYARATSSLTSGNSPLLNLPYTVWNLDLCTRPDSSELSLSCQVCLLQLLSSVQPHPTISHSCGLKKRANRSTQHSRCCCEQTW